MCVRDDQRICSHSFDLKSLTDRRDNTERKQEGAGEAPVGGLDPIFPHFHFTRRPIGGHFSRLPGHRLNDALIQLYLPQADILRFVLTPVILQQNNQPSRNRSTKTAGKRDNAQSPATSQASPGKHR